MSKDRRELVTRLQPDSVGGIVDRASWDEMVSGLSPGHQALARFVEWCADKEVLARRLPWDEPRVTVNLGMGLTACQTLVQIVGQGMLPANMVRNAEQSELRVTFYCGLNDSSDEYYEATRGMTRQQREQFCLDRGMRMVGDEMAIRLRSEKEGEWLDLRPNSHPVDSMNPVFCEAFGGEPYPVYIWPARGGDYRYMNEAFLNMELGVDCARWDKVVGSFSPPEQAFVRFVRHLAGEEVIGKQLRWDEPRPVTEWDRYGGSAEAMVSRVLKEGYLGGQYFGLMTGNVCRFSWRYDLDYGSPEYEEKMGQLRRSSGPDGMWDYYPNQFRKEMGCRSCGFEMCVCYHGDGGYLHFFPNVGTVGGMVKDFGRMFDGEPFPILVTNDRRLNTPVWKYENPAYVEQFGGSG